MTLPAKKGDPVVVSKDEHPRETTLEQLAKLKPIVRDDGTVTAGNASGVNDGSCALLIASEAAAKKHGLTPRARILGMASAGVAPRIMGMGPRPPRRSCSRGSASAGREDGRGRAERGLRRAGDRRCCASWACPTTRAHVNPNGGAIALGHPLGASGARLVTTAMYQLARTGGRYALCTMCIGVGQGIALVIERV